ncbi:biuret amidohydrolase [Paenibacillus sabuli]|uniref:biuret amidohydrolase n=1 Tax=Paenibacillus sabuli TaxID=2772509 RepID=UPI00295B991A|nr:isochorismatase family cysteine hydrolase [Paenibacillus sabuli]
MERRNSQRTRTEGGGAAAQGGKDEANGAVKAVPYDWPYDGALVPVQTALLVIDMQHDFCGKGGYIDRMGYDLSVTARAIEPIRRVLDAVRRVPGFTVIYSREGHRPDLADLPPIKRWRSALAGAEIGSEGPCGRILVRGEPGWQIVDRLTPAEGEIVLDKPGKGSFYATDLDLILRTRGIRKLVLTGITTDVGVQTTLREANDRGYECVVLEDCTGATDVGNHIAALKMITMQGGVFGALSDSDRLIAALLRLELGASEAGVESQSVAKAAAEGLPLGQPIGSGERGG